MKQGDLSKAKILIADSDGSIAEVLRQMLVRMGFSSVGRVNNGRKAFEAIHQHDIDILITENHMDEMDGLTLISKIRDYDQSPNVMMPIIMLTGKAERPDVERARDTGVTEFVVKPFSSATLFDRIKKLFDAPRDFILSEGYTGPDRRHAGSPPEGMENRRIMRPTVISSAIVKSVDFSTPKLIPQEFTLKRKIGITGSISSIITPQVLSDAQAAIDNFKSDSERWIADDMSALEAQVSKLEAYDHSVIPQVERTALSIKSRAGTFGYDLAASVAFGLYVFMHHDFRIGQNPHILVIRKHIDVLKVLLANHILGGDSKLQEQLASELFRMTAKLKQT